MPDKYFQLDDEESRAHMAREFADCTPEQIDAMMDIIFSLREIIKADRDIADPDIPSKTASLRRKSLAETVFDTKIRHYRSGVLA